MLAQITMDIVLGETGMVVFSRFTISSVFSLVERWNILWSVSNKRGLAIIIDTIMKGFKYIVYYRVFNAIA